MKKLDGKITAVPKWDKSAEQIWDERFDALTSADAIGKNVDKVKSISTWHRVRYFVSAAAALVIIMTATSLLYVKSFSSEVGQMRIVHLPDGSTAELSAGTTISIRPILWPLIPRVEMDGEAYFSGKHTKGFTVNTEKGNITVIGTSFNVNAIDNLSVACLEGKIKVSNDKSTVVLTANQQATEENGQMKIARIEDAESVTGWTKGIFSFNNEPLKDVLLDVERYYGVKVSVSDNIDTLRYTGRFTRDRYPEEVLSIISQTYGITLKLVK